MTYDSRLDDIHEKLSTIDKSLAVYNEQLKMHMKRTDLLETKVTALDQDVTKLRGFFSVGGWIVGIAATLLVIGKEFYGLFSK